MKNVIEERIQVLGDSVKLYRLVKDRDVVPKVPPTFLAFQHLGTHVSIEADDTICFPEAMLDHADGDANVDDLRDLDISPLSEDDDEEKKEASEKTRYEKWIGRVPKSLRDHMPEL